MAPEIVKYVSRLSRRLQPAAALLQTVDFLAKMAAILRLTAMTDDHGNL
jgi:hypothetical protein